MKRRTLLTIGLLLLWSGFAQSQTTTAAGEARVLAASEARTRPDSIEIIFSQRINEQVLREMQNAWLVAGGGTARNEIVILLFKETDGSLRAETQNYTNHPKGASFVWKRSAIAIVHTHPNFCDPKPSEVDKETADRLHVPIFTLTSRGMYVYDPASEKTVELKKSLVWLDARNWSIEKSGAEIAANLRPGSK